MAKVRSGRIQNAAAMPTTNKPIVPQNGSDQLPVRSMM